MGFIEDYGIFLKYAKHLLFGSKLSILPEDLINDAYIMFVDCGKEYSMAVIKSLIKQLFFKESDHSSSVVTYGSQHKKNRYLPDTAFCPKCKQTKASAEFYISYIQSKGRKSISGYCKLCYDAVIKDWRKRNPEKTKIFLKASHQNFYRKNRVRLRIKQREYVRNNYSEIIGKRATEEYKSKKKLWDSNTRAKERKRLYYLQNRERLLAYQNKYYNISKRS